VGNAEHETEEEQGRRHGLRQRQGLNCGRRVSE